MDFLTQGRLYGYRYNTPDKREPATANRDIYRENAPKLFSTPRVKVHDCRTLGAKNLTDRRDWEAWVLSDGLRHSVQATGSLHTKDKTQQSNKLLYTVGEKGFQVEQFTYPRQLVISEDGTILTADSGNHRIQSFNQCGVFVNSFGEKGAEPGQFREPTGVALLSNGFVVVADHRNKRIQILNPSGEFKHEFPTSGMPFFACVDSSDNIIVSTTSGTIEIYKRTGTLVSEFKIPGPKSKGHVKIAACQIAVNNKAEVIVSNGHLGVIQYYCYSGKLKYQFEAVSTSDGMACQPSGIFVNPHSGEVIVADSLNHVINQYSERGVLTSQLICPQDGAGAVQDVALGPEGHLVALEYTTNGPHCLKIFRHSECDCHKERPGSAKKK